MIADLKRILSQAETWPAEDQAALLAAAREIEAERSGTYVMSDEERAAVEEGLAQAERGEFASEAEVEAIFRRARGGT